MRLAPTIARAGFGLALGAAAAACGDNATSPERLPPQATVRDIGDSTVVIGWAEAINGQGHVVGFGQRAMGDGQYEPYRWTVDGGLTWLGRLPGTGGNGFATGINDRGDIVGGSGARAFVWTAAGGVRDLGMLPGVAAENGIAQAAGVNRFGQAVGTVRAPSSPRPVLFVTKPGR